MSNEGEITEDIIAAWEADHPEIPITLIASDATRLNAMLAAGDPPDLVRELGGTGTPYIASRGLAVALDDYVAASSVLSAGDLNSINDVWRWADGRQGEGPLYGLVKDWSQDMMFWYSMTAFEEAGLPLPSDDRPLTYDDLLEYGIAMTKASGGKVQQYGLYGTNPSIEFIEGMLATTGVSAFSEDLKSVDFSSPEAQRALRWFVDVADAKAGYSLVDPNPEGWDWPGFSTGKQAMAQAGYWFTGAVGGDEKAGEWARMAPAPLLGDRRVSPTTAGTGHWIPAGSKKQDEAFAFLEWFTAGQPAIDRSTSGWGLPPVNSLMENLPQKEPFQQAAAATQKAEEAYFAVLSFSPYAQASAVSAAIAEVFPDAANGKISVAALGDQITTRVNDLLAEGVTRAGA